MYVSPTRMHTWYACFVQRATLCGVNESRSMHVFGILSLVCGLRSLAPLPKHKFIYRGWEGSLLGTLFFEDFRSTSWHFKRPRSRPLQARNVFATHEFSNFHYAK